MATRSKAPLFIHVQKWRKAGSLRLFVKIKHLPHSPIRLLLSHGLVQVHLHLLVPKTNHWQRGRISVIGLALDLSRSSALVALLPCVREETYGWCEVHCHVHTILAGQDPTPSSDRREVLLQVPLIDAHLLLSRRGSVCTHKFRTSSWL